MKEIEIEGKTVTMAVESGLKEIGMRRDQVEVQVLEEGSAGFLGMGGKLAKVRIRQKLWGESSSKEEEDDNRGNRIEDYPAHKSKPSNFGNTAPGRRSYSRAPQPRVQESSRPPARAPQRESKPRVKPAANVEIDTAKACEFTTELLEKILSLSGLTDAKVQSAWDAGQSRVKADVSTVDAGLIIGKGGKTLEALQFLVTVMLGRKLATPVAVQVEIDGYWRKIEEEIISEVKLAVAEVKRTGQPHRFSPMEPAMRRLVHRCVAEDPEVETASEGEGSWRKVVLRPRSK